MKICQTLWTCNKNLFEDSFGWSTPQHHVLAWAYSCLKLKEFYPNVQLYTDSHGTEVLIETLNLPYTECHIVYDNFKYNPALWALPKIITYKKQTEPFIHVDGDVFIYDKFNEIIENADLLAQNLEISTSYYNKLFRPIIKNIKYIPDFFKENLFSKYPKAYNAGILGGNNLELIKKYTDEVIALVEENFSCQANANFNMIFEQLLFYSIAEANSANIKCLFDGKYDDNGYTLDKFGDFLNIPSNKYLHLIGPLKRNGFVFDQLIKRFYLEYPGYFKKVISKFEQPLHIYFKQNNVETITQKNNFNNKSEPSFFRTKMLLGKLYPKYNLEENNNIASIVESKNNYVLNEVFEFEREINHLINNVFSLIGPSDISTIEEKITESNLYIKDIDVSGTCCTLTLNPYIEIVETAFDILSFDPFKIINGEDNKKTIACIPQLFYEGYKLIELDDMCINIILTLHERLGPTVFIDLENEMLQLFERVENDEKSIRRLLIKKIKFLIGNNIIYIEKSIQKEPPILK